MGEMVQWTQRKRGPEVLSTPPDPLTGHLLQPGDTALTHATAVSPYPQSSERESIHIVRDEQAPDYDGQSRRPVGFAVIPAGVRDLKNGYATAVYAVLAAHANRAHECWPSIPTICDETGWGRTKVMEVLDLLEEHKIIQRDHRFAHGMKAANRYVLTVETAEVKKSATRTTKSATRTQVVRHADLGSPPHGHKQDSVEQDSIEQESTPLPPKGASAKKPTYSSEFETFWTAYPTGHGVKTKTFAEWKKLDADSRAAALAAIPGWQRSDKWQRGFVRDAQRWLSYREFEQEPPAPPGSGPHPSRNGHQKMTGQEMLAVVLADRERKRAQTEGDVIEADWSTT